MPAGWVPEPVAPSLGEAAGTVLILVDPVDHCITPRGATRLERLLARLHAMRLDHALAAGASPDATAELALRGQSLVRPRERLMLARSVQRLIYEAGRPQPRLYRSGSPIRRDRVREAAAELQELVDHLLAPGPVSAHGMAHVSVLLSDGGGPLYHPGAGGGQALRQHVRAAINALDPLHDW